MGKAAEKARELQRARELRIEPVGGEGDLLAALAIREVVFIEEQRVPECMERDEEDALAHHVLAYDGGHTIGTGRLVMLSRGPEGEVGRWARIGRMAVLAAYRGKGVGARILDALEEEASLRKVDGILLHAQLHARAFYEHAGYEGFGPVFDEAGMPHLMMRKRLPSTPVAVSG
jgi:predicted GNAT family N-acyltransferase